MKKIITACFLVIVFAPSAQAQMHHHIIQKEDVSRIINTLASDDMIGRKTFTPGLKRAAAFIVKQFEEIGLEPFQNNDSYRQEFKMISTSPEKVSATIGAEQISPENILAVTTQEHLSWTNESNPQIKSIGPDETFFTVFRKYMNPDENTLVWVDKKFAPQFARLKQYVTNGSSFPNSVSTVFVLSDASSAFTLEITNKRTIKKTANIVGVLTGKTLPDEYVVFSAHYDHLGKGKPVNGDAIYNGANDNASGTTAVIELAKYYKAKGGNNRTLIFVTFTGEESGGYGSSYFSKQLDPEKVAAMFNIKMIGTQSKWGTNSAYITGFNKTNFGKILQSNLKNSSFQFHPDPYPKQNLFYRSDNATLARLGVPAHTISTSTMANEPYYHKVSDEVGTLDLENMTRIIRAIAISAESIVSGQDTPTRVDVKSLN